MEASPCSNSHRLRQNDLPEIVFVGQVVALATT
jgi:hypothetical protein